VRSPTDGNVEIQVLTIDAPDPLAAGATFLQRVGESIDVDLPAEVAIDLDIRRAEDDDSEETPATAVAETEPDIEDEIETTESPMPEPSDDPEGDSGPVETQLDFVLAHGSSESGSGISSATAPSKSEPVASGGFDTASISGSSSKPVVVSALDRESSLVSSWLSVSSASAPSSALSVSSVSSASFSL
jgi:hypothetical protein